MPLLMLPALQDSEISQLKSPFGTLVLLQYYIVDNACDKVSGTNFIEVPCKEVKLYSDFLLASAEVPKLAFSIVDLIKASSTSVSI
jgi:hypothetical protein